MMVRHEGANIRKNKGNHQMNRHSMPVPTLSGWPYPARPRPPVRPHGLAWER
jgi:hypothetical protein